MDELRLFTKTHPFRLVKQRARRQRTNRPCQDAFQKTNTVFHRRAPESWASPSLHAHTGEVRFTGPGLIPRRKPYYPAGRQTVLFRTKRLSRWKEATKAYKKTTKEDSTRGAPGSRAVPPSHAHTTNLYEERIQKTFLSGELRTTGSFRLSTHTPERFASSSDLCQ